MMKYVILFSHTYKTQWIVVFLIQVITKVIFFFFAVDFPASASAWPQNVTATHHAGDTVIESNMEMDNFTINGVELEISKGYIRMSYASYTPKSYW